MNNNKRERERGRWEGLEKTNEPVRNEMYKSFSPFTQLSLSVDYDRRASPATVQPTSIQHGFSVCFSCIIRIFSSYLLEYRTSVPPTFANTPLRPTRELRTKWTFLDASRAFCFLLQLLLFRHVEWRYTRARAHTRARVCVCVCVWEREREREREKVAVERGW